MALQVQKEKLSLKLVSADGFTEGGKEKFRTKTYSGVNPEVTDEALYRAGEGIKSLILDDVRTIKKVEESVLVEQA